MNISIYQVDAFASRPFEGNPAAVCPLDAWLSDELMQSIAAENNLSETAFFVREGSSYAIRWFTPAAEVDLCGHATLASAWVLFNCLGFEGEEVCFSSKSGPLHVSRDGDQLVLDFPAQPPRPCTTPPGVVEAFGAEPVECLEYVDLLVIFDDPEIVLNAKPEMHLLDSESKPAVPDRIEHRGCWFSVDEWDLSARSFLESVVAAFSSRLGSKQAGTRCGKWSYLWTVRLSNVYGDQVL